MGNLPPEVLHVYYLHHSYPGMPVTKAVTTQ
jgi:hypothetical protein